jgi:hypothetical protein
MSPEEKTALMARREKDERVLIYRNLLNGLPVWKVMEVFRKSEKDVMDTFRLVSRRVEEYVFQRRLPPVYCDCIAVAQKSKDMLLSLLPKLNLDKPAALGRLTHNKFSGGVPADAVIEVLREMRQ